jgi:hypothetical protein
MAGFQVTLYGRIWVTAEGSGEEKQVNGEKLATLTNENWSVRTGQGELANRRLQKSRRETGSVDRAFGLFPEGAAVTKM